MDSAKIVFETEIETKIASELAQQLVENQMNIIKKMQEEVLAESSKDWYLSELEGAIDGLAKLIPALRSGDFVIVTTP